MTREDIYGQELFPGDIICYTRKGELAAGLIHSISLKGTIYVKPWKSSVQQFSAIPQRTTGYRIIKIKSLI